MLIKNMLFGYYDTQCLYAITELDIADHLQNGPQSIVALAQLTGAEEGKLYRVMRFMSAKGLFNELPDKVFELNQESEYLVSSAPDNLNNFIKLHANYFYTGASELANSMKMTTTPFELKFGKLAGTYFKDHAVAGEIYNTAMKESSEHYGKLIADTYDFSSCALIVDVGGGLGSLLANILLKNKNSRGINYDLPALQKTAEAYFEEMGIASRCQYIGGDFFKSVPKGGDLYMMKAILHGKNDAAAIEVLHRCKDVLSSQVKLLVIERTIAKDENYIDACVNDINMLNVTHGYVRTEMEFKALFRAAGYSITKLYPLQDALTIIETAVSAA